MSMRARRALIFCATTLLLGAGAIFGAGEYLSAPVHHSPGDPPPELFATPVLIPNGKGYVAGWVARGAGSGAVLLLHGVRADRRQMQARADFLNRAGFTVLLIDLPSHGESVHAAAPEPKQLWIVDGAAHVDLHAFSPSEYERRVGGFLQMHLLR